MEEVIEETHTRHIFCILHVLLNRGVNRPSPTCINVTNVSDKSVAPLVQSQTDKIRI